MASLTDTLGTATTDQFRQFLSWAFPGADRPDDAQLEGFLRAFYRAHGPLATDAGLPPLSPAELAPTPEERARAAALADAAPFPLFIANATHHRVRSMTSADLGGNSNVPFQSQFVGHLPVVRVPLPSSFPIGANPSVSTPIGAVYFSSDHLVGSVQLVAEKFSSALGYTPARVDLVTPARTGITRSRFGAIAVYLGYRNADDTEPSFYILEAGMATGEARVIYFAPSMDTTIVQQSGYHPTAYSSEQNFYRGNLTVTNDQPIALMVQAIPPNETYYIQISVSYQPVTSTSNDPFELLVEAAARIALIGQNMGAPSGIPLQSLMARVALTLPWVTIPAFGGPGTLGDKSSA